MLRRSRIRPLFLPAACWLYAHVALAAPSTDGKNCVVSCYKRDGRGLCVLGDRAKKLREANPQIAMTCHGSALEAFKAGNHLDYDAADPRAIELTYRCKAAPAAPPATYEFESSGPAFRVRYAPAGSAAKVVFGQLSEEDLKTLREVTNATLGRDALGPRAKAIDAVLDQSHDLDCTLAVESLGVGVGFREYSQPRDNERFWKLVEPVRGRLRRAHAARADLKAVPVL